MNPRFQQLMMDATRLSCAGELTASLAAIQSALAGQGSTPQACATTSDPATVIDVQARVVPEPTEAPKASAAASPVSQFISGSYRNHAGTREYKLFVPPLMPGRPRALLVMLHGCTQHPDDFAAGTRMNELALQHNALVLYPAQAQQANAQRCWSWFKHNHQARDRGEPSILAGMTQELIRAHGIDGRHVFIAGLSAGGAMAAIMGAAYPELFAAVGVHSGLPAGAAHDLPSALAAMKGSVSQPRSTERRARTVPTIVFHGDADTTVHPDNGMQIIEGLGPSVATQQQDFRQGGRQGSRSIRRAPDGRVLGEHWVVHGAGHAWIGGSSAGSYTDPQGPDASKEMLRFFFNVAAG
jgi:poly(hydroxyalkanoate) depolymerase family esterase